ncbi:hypothetical protein AAVH_19462 [Aphelenchoides avenae]|nr:hypothetical protein AAVH_19462 [Aphelenchus avenae]
MDTDVFIEVLRFLPRSEVEKLLLVSRRWSNVVKGAEGSLQQRHCFTVMPKFYVESPGMLSLYFFRTHLDQWRILRVLTTRGLSQALNAVLSHMRNAFVENVLPYFSDCIITPRPPRKMLVDVPLSRGIDWLKSLLRSMPLNSEIGAWCVVDYAAEFDTLPTLANCALEAHRKLECVQKLEVGLFDRDAAWAQLSSLLSQPSIREFREISIATTRVAMDTSGLHAILPSLQSLKLHLFVSSVVDPQDTLLTLPTQIILDFMALRDANNFTAEFSLHIKKPDNVAFAEMPDVGGTTDRRRRFRYAHKGVDTVVRVSVYKNPTARRYLSVVTFDHFCRNVVFFNGNMSVTELKQVFHRPYDLY